MYKIDKYLAEETGVHIGDGSLNIYKNNNPCYTVACHKKDDKEYMDTFLLPLIKRVYKKEPKPRYWSRGTYGFRIRSMKILQFKHNTLGLPLGKKKDIIIPSIIRTNNYLMKFLIRGLFDTDGSITIWRTNNKLYPRIYFSNISEKLVNQIKDYLQKEGFRVTYWKTIYKDNNWNTIHKLSINGYIMLFKWANEIGFKNPKNLKKIQVLKSKM